MKHTAKSIREALEAGKRVLLAGDVLECTAPPVYFQFHWRGRSVVKEDLDLFITELQDKVEVVEPERPYICALYVGTDLTYGGQKRLFLDVPSYAEPWTEKCDVVVIRKSDLPEALKQLGGLQ